MDARHEGEHDASWNKVVFMGSGLGPSGRPGMTRWFCWKPALRGAHFLLRRFAL
jgi:hypothetical protein